jgi:hypothetical protein
MKISLPKIFMKAFVLTALFSCSSSWSQVTLPHYDGLEYTLPAVLQAQTGWTAVNTGDDLTIVAGSLNYFGLPISVGNRVQFGGAGIDATKQFTAQAVGFGTIYYSFLLNVTSVTGLNTTGGYQTAIADNSTNFASTMWLRSDGLGG